MPLKVRGASAFSDAVALRQLTAGGWLDRPGRYYNGAAWVDFMQTTKPYSAISSRSYNDGWYYATDDATVINIDTWQSDNGLAQGRYASPHDWGGGYETAGYAGPFYGTFYFGSGAGRPTELDGKAIVSAQIYLKRYSDSPGSASAVPVYLYKSPLTSVPGSGARSPDGAVTGTGYLICSLTKGQGGWYTLPNALAQAIMDGYCLCIYSGGSNLTRLYGIESASYKPQVKITVQ